MRIVFEKGLVDAIKRQGGIALYANISKGKIRIYAAEKLEKSYSSIYEYFDRHYIGENVNGNIYLGCIENAQKKESKEGIKHMLAYALYNVWEYKNSREFFQENGILDEGHIYQICY